MLGKGGGSVYAGPMSIRALLLLLLACFSPPALAGPQERIDQLFAALQRAGPDEWQVIEAEIRDLWSDSGSPTLNLLLARGYGALEEGESKAAIEHFTALIDHAPDFAEAWNGRATAYFAAGLYGPALGDIAHALALEPRHFGALTGLAMILEEAGLREQALAAYRAVLALSPHRPDVQEAIRALEREAGMFDS